MDPNVIRSLRSCIDTCERLMSEAQRDKDRYRQCLSGELLKEYEKASDTAYNEIKKIKSSLYNLLLEEQMSE